ncbi:MAG: AsmA-like C-terminal domain-containing protein [Desulfococcaceae bacterium]
MKNKFRILIKWISVCALLSAIICAGIFVWLRMTLPSFTFLNARIEDSLKKLAPDYRIEFAEIKLAASVRHLIPGVQVSDIRIYCGETALLLCPELFASFSLSGLMSGQMRPVKIHIREPHFAKFPLLLPAQSSLPQISASVNSRKDASQQIADALSGLFSLVLEYKSFREFNMQDAVVDTEEPGFSGLAEIPDIRAKIVRKKNGIILKANIRTGFQKSDPAIEGQLVWSAADKSVQVNAEFRNINPSELTGLIPKSDFIRNCRFPVQGKIQARIAAGNTDISLLELSSSGGTLFHPSVWEKPLHMEKMDIRAAVADNFSRINLHSFLIAFAEPDFHGPEFSGTGNIRLVPKQPEINMDIRADHLKPDRSHRYWPYSLAPSARTWIQHHFKSGDIDGAELKLRIGPKDWQQNILPENVLTARVPFQHISLDYHPPLKPVYDVAGVGEFTFHGVNIQVSQGRVYQTLVEKGQVNIRWMKEQSDISIEAHTQGPPDDLRQAVDALAGQESPTFLIAEGTARTRLTFAFPLEHFAAEAFLYTAESEMQNIQIPDFHGVGISLKSLSAELRNQEIAFKGSGGEVLSPAYLESPVSVKSIQGNGQLLYAPPGMIIENLSTDLNGPQITGSGFVKYKGDYPHIDANIQVNQLLIQNALACWPLPLAASAREWIKNRFSSGLIDNASVRINMEPQIFRHKDLPKTAVEAIVPFSGVTLNYHPSLPMLKKGAGIAVFYADSMNAELKSGIAGNSRIENGTVRIINMAGEKAEMEIEAAVSGPVHDLLNAAESLGSKYEGPEITGGDAKTKLAIDLPLVSDLSGKDVQLKGFSEIKNIAIPDISGISLSQGNINVRFEGDKVDARGSINAGTAKLAVDLQTGLSKRQNAADVLRVSGTVNADRLKDFGLSPMPFLKGTASCRAVFIISPNHTGIDFTADVENMDMNLKQVGWHKAKGRKGILTVKADTAAKNITLSEIQLSGNGFDISGSGKIRSGTQTGQMISDLHFDRVHFGSSDFVLQISTGAEYAIRISGKNFDAGPLIQYFSLHNSKEKSGIETSAKSKTKKDSFSGNISADVEKLGLLHDIELYGLGFSGQWKNSRLISAQMQGSHSKNEKVSLSFSPRTGGSRINIRSDNAGLLLKGFDISKDIIGGQLELAADAQGDFPAEKTVRAKLNMRNFALVNVSLLTKILSAASFVGILEQMKSGGVAFDTLEADLEYADQVLSLIKTRMEGLSMGMTAEGRISLKDGSLELKGVVVPFNLVNKMLDMIPLLGRLIVGDGIIATNYTATGAYKDPDVRIEPLSTLAIGSLRTVFSHIELRKPSYLHDETWENMKPQNNN